MSSPALQPVSENEEARESTPPRLPREGRRELRAAIVGLLYGIGLASFAIILGNAGAGDRFPFEVSGFLPVVVIDLISPLAWFSAPAVSLLIGIFVNANYVLSPLLWATTSFFAVRSRRSDRAEALARGLLVLQLAVGCLAVFTAVRGDGRRFFSEPRTAVAEQFFYAVYFLGQITLWTRLITNGVFRRRQNP